jgi:hypothetical protein
MTTLKDVAEHNARGELVEWSLVPKAQCPHCGKAGCVEVCQKYITQKPGTFSLAGVMTKFPAKIGWVYRCLECKKEGKADPHD